MMRAVLLQPCQSIILVSKMPPHIKWICNQRVPKGGAAKPQSQQSDYEIAVAFLNEKEKIRAARFAPSKESTTKDVILGCTDNFDAMPAGNTAATVEAGLGGGM